MRTLYINMGFDNFYQNVKTANCFIIFKIVNEINIEFVQWSKCGEKELAGFDMTINCSTYDFW